MQAEREGLHEPYMEEEMAESPVLRVFASAFGYIWKKKNFQIKPKIIPKTSLAGLQSCMIIMQNPVNLLFQHRPEEIRGKADENQADSRKLLK